ncbi:MAG: DNA polymerase III subunit alpha [Spirochaetaceae bacterium]|nr:DNA polymerase III subunit alpha [Spirochaetaceae bacterium]
MSEFVHLHNHSDYSLLDGAAPIARYIEKAKEVGMKSLALTDHGNMFGSLRFYYACKENDINPIVGCEFYTNPKGHTEKPKLGIDNSHRYHLILLAMNEVGYHNLMKLNSIAFTEGYYYKPRIDDELLQKYNEGIICLSACLGGEILQLLLKDKYEEAKKRALWYNSVFDNDRYYLEIQNHGLEDQKKTNPLLARLSKETGIPLICTNDIHYIEKSDAEAQDILLCIGTASKVQDVKRMRFPCPEFYFKTQEEMEELFIDYPEAVKNTEKVANMCNLTINLPGPILPVCDIPAEFKNEGDYLRFLSYEGIKKRYNPVPPEYMTRLEYELGVIIHMDFPGYFLIVRDYIHWAKVHDIPVGPGRGSGAGSIVAYSLDITDVDPMKYNLLFERFLNPERVSMPDFDIDFCQERRGEVIDYVTEHYGQAKVAQIATFGTLKTKAVLKDCARALAIPFSEANKIAKLIPDERNISIPIALEMSEELRAIRAQGGIYETLFDVATRLEGLNRHTSTHAAGVVIGRKDLVEYVPLYRDSKTGATSTQYTMDLIEPCGLVKMDFLGLKTLTLIKHCEDLIHKKDPLFKIEDISETDPATFKMLQAGDSTAVFQFESAGMQKILKQAEPSNMEDLVALNALYRPGPMAYIPQFIECKHGRQPITYADPALEEELKTTYGVIVYQEQVMKVAQIIAGYTLGQADILRRIMGKKKVDKLAHEKLNFIAGAAKKGHSKEHASEIFEMLEPFAGYGFNKSHAVAYSVVAYQTAFLKANYPAEFLAANLTNEMNNPDKFTEYLNVAEAMGLEIMAPTINYSEQHFSVVDNKIVYGLAGIKNVGSAAVTRIVVEREKNGTYKDFIDFLKRSESRILNSKLLESLITAGAFDSIGINRNSLLNCLPDAIKFAQMVNADKAYGQLSLFGEEEESSFNQFNIPLLEDWSIMEKLEKERELLGFYISGHPLDVYKDEMKNSVVVDLSVPQKIKLGKSTQLIATINTKRVILTTKGTEMCFMNISDKNGSVDCTLFPKLYEKCKDKIELESIQGFIGKFQKNYKDDTKIDFTIEDIKDPKELPPLALTACYVKVNKTVAKSTGLLNLRDTCLDHAGSLSLTILIEEKEDILSNLDEVDLSAVEDEETEKTSKEDDLSTLPRIVCGNVFNVKKCPEFIEDVKALPEVTDIWFD